MFYTGVRKINSGNNLQKSCGQVIITGTFPKDDQIFLSAIHALLPAAIGLPAGINAGRRCSQPKHCGRRGNHSGALRLSSLCISENIHPSRYFTLSCFPLFAFKTTYLDSGMWHGKSFFRQKLHKE